MPEYRECWAHYLFILLFLLSHSDNNWNLIALWADSVKDSEPGANKSGHVYELPPTSTAERGQNNKQTPLYPPMLRQKPPKKPTKSKPTPTPSDSAKTSKPPQEIQPAPLTIKDLKLRNVHPTNRAVILDLGPVFLKVSKKYLLLEFER